MLYPLSLCVNAPFYRYLQLQATLNNSMSNQGCKVTSNQLKTSQTEGYTLINGAILAF